MLVGWLPQAQSEKKVPFTHTYCSCYLEQRDKGCCVLMIVISCVFIKLLQAMANFLPDIKWKVAKVALPNPYL